MSLDVWYYYQHRDDPPPEQFVTLASAIRGPIAYGPRVTQPGTVVPPIVARLYRRADLNDPIVEFDQSFDRQFQDQIDESGSGRLSILNDDPDLAFLSHSDVVRFEVNGWAAFAMLVRESERVAIAPGEEVDMVTTLSGPGHFAIFDEALVYPARGPGSLPAEEDRPFNWVSVDYDDQWWGFAKQICRADSVPPGNEGWWDTVVEAGFPDPEAYWISAHDVTATHSPRKGISYLRHVFYLGAEADVTVLGTIDNGGDLYIDGQLLIADMNDLTSVWTAMQHMSAGAHTLAVSMEEPAGDLVTIDPTGCLFAGYVTDGNGILTTRLFHTDSSWRIVEFPPSAPGMTPGEVIIHAITEAMARGCLPPITFNFDRETDSAGNAWPEVTDIATKTGTDLLTFLRELTATYVDLWMEPGSWRLWAWAKGTRGDTQDVALHGVTDPTDPFSGNLAGLTLHVVL